MQTIDEKTQVITNPADIERVTIQTFSNIRHNHDVCTDAAGSSLIMGIEWLKKIFVDAHARGIRFRFITEITKDNLSYCKQIMEIAELRHLNGLHANFGVSETEYLSAVTLDKEKAAPILVYSNVKQIVKQQQFIFQTLWQRAIPAEQRMREIAEETAVRIETRLIDDPSEMIELFRKQLLSEEKRWSVCSPVDGLMVARNKLLEEHKKFLADSAIGKKRGERWLTTFNKEDVPLVREFLDMGMQIRHYSKQELLPMVFSVSDKTLNATVDRMQGGRLMRYILTSNEPLYVQYYNSLFEELWRDGIDALDRIKQIEEDIEPEFVEVITDGIKGANLMVDFAVSVRKEAQVILPQPKTMERAEKLGIWDYLIHAANSYGAEIQVISPITKENSELARQIMNQAPNIQILAGPVSTAGLFIQDGERYFKAEDKNPHAAEASEAISIVIYSNSKNGVKSFRSFFETLWKQSELYEQLRIANEKLIFHDSMQREFINIAAHELRTPIQPILGLAEILGLQFSEEEGGGGRDEEEEEKKTTKEKGEITRDELAILARNAKRLERLSSNILDIARIESGTLHLTIQEFNLNDVILPLVQDARDEVKSRDKAGHDITVLYSPSGGNSIIVKGDKDRISEVVSNLLDNAIKFTEKGGAISIETEKDDNYVRITIKDNGRGIDLEVLPKLFSKFVTKSEKGTGLGLFISKKIVEAHGGRIWAENSRNGKGAIFAFTLPI